MSVPMVMMTISSNFLLLFLSHWSYALKFDISVLFLVWFDFQFAYSSGYFHVNCVHYVWLIAAFYYWREIQHNRNITEALMLLICYNATTIVLFMIAIYIHNNTNSIMYKTVIVSDIEIPSSAIDLFARFVIVAVISYNL